MIERDRRDAGNLLLVITGTRDCGRSMGGESESGSERTREGGREGRGASVFHLRDKVKADSNKLSVRAA
jgi:hypothetical protein